MTGCIEQFRLPLPNRIRSAASISSQFIEISDEVDNIDYRFELARLESFKNWPCAWMKPEKLAAAGFYYTGESDKVKCFECHVEICQWQPDDSPMVDHQRWSGRCRFVRNIPCGNVPIGADPNMIPTPMSKGYDVCGPYGTIYMPFSGPDNEDFTENMKFNLGLFNSPMRPKHPEYGTYEARLSTFETWPKAMSQTKEELAEAGFFYTGNGDQTLCYHCGGGLRDWEPEDDPWEQHAKWFDYCSYLLMTKGKDYVNKFIGKTYAKPDIVKSCTTTEQDLTSNEDECIAGSSQSSTNSEDKENITSFSTGSSEANIEEQSTVKASCDKPVDKDARMCKICYSRELRMVFMPCGHLLACAECAKNMKICGVCRKPVKITVQAYIP
ncbi:Apoptosis inhibitor IAP [Camponotus floridanus]|uniref:Apoptosis inhibitor IAP n=2 Tax=Camponotus floridanus TaxID=104421 RepID=E2A7A8_CAMFO|nr:death-associated inhibitor of apoptosis 1 isoform X2 [Camponotus floridanus]EFN70605.1 Apoptosis inhibitor IAP [Camponotus floridanus]